MDTLLSADGRFSVILPADALDSFWSTAMEFKLYPCRQLQVMTKATAPVKRILLELRRQSTDYSMERLIMRDESGEYSDAYRKLTQDFYIKL